VHAGGGRKSMNFIPLALCKFCGNKVLIIKIRVFVYFTQKCNFFCQNSVVVLKVTEQNTERKKVKNEKGKKEIIKRIKVNKKEESEEMKKTRKEK
jgi:hypothetical protein